jgi:ferrous iron transport protein A
LDKILTKNHITMKTKDLTQLAEGESGVVVGIYGGYGLIRRLEALGIREGKRVTKVSSQLMRGPVTLRVDNGQVAMGFGMASKIMVELKD